MITICPNCRSQRIATINLAKKTCGFLGLVGGLASSTTGTFAGAEIGATFGLIAGPPGATLGALAGAIMGALLAGTSVGIAGARLGEVIDDRILDNYKCLACNYVFSHLPSKVLPHS
jgi:hypothetical protein